MKYGTLKTINNNGHLWTKGHKMTIKEFKVGDEVVIGAPNTKKEKSYWVSSMNKYIGHKGKITELANNSYSVRIQYKNKHKKETKCVYWFPVSCLRFAVPSICTVTKPNSVNESSKHISHYPHKCPKCGAASYNNTFFNKIDCSREGCNS